MLIFLAMLSILILVHEFGHFIVARRLGIRVEKFSLGFGPKLFGIKGKQTEYTICAIPIGGYIKMAGDTRESSTGKRDEFLSRPKRDKAKVIIMGSVFNYILSFFCFWAVFFIGFPVMTSKVGGLIDDMPAKRAGLQVGDRIVSVDDQKTEYWEDVAAIIHDKKQGENVHLFIDRDGEEINMSIEPEFRKTKNLLGEEINIGLVGITPSEETIIVKYGLFESLRMGSRRLIGVTSLTFQAVCRMASGRLSFRESMTGPLGIFFESNKAIKFGPVALIHLTALLGVSLAIFNLLPVPILDGGHLFFLFLEHIRGKALSERTEEFLNRISLTLLLVLVAFVFYNDFIKYKIIDRVVKFFSAL